MDNFVIVQILGAITLILYVAAFQQRKKETFLLLQSAGSLFFVIQYILTGRITGAVIFIIITIRGIVYYFYKRKGIKPSLAILILFQAILIVSTYLTWQSIFSIFPYIATAGKTWGTWQDEMKWARRTSLLAQCCMIVYNLSAAMYTGTLTEVCNMTSNLIAIWRFDIRKQVTSNN